MKLLRTTIILAISALLPAAVCAKQEAEAPATTVALDGVDLKDVGAESARFEMRSHVTASRKLKLKRVSFAHMRLGSVPIYLSPIEEHLDLEKGAAVTLPRIPVTIYFRDLDSLDPLLTAVRDGNVSVTGQARADLDLSLIERVASRESSPHANMPIDVTIAVNVPGGANGRTAALAALRAAQIALNLGSSAIGRLHLSRKGWETELRTRFEPSVLLAESRYSLRLKNGELANFAVRGLGFCISEDKFVLTDEMIQPWKYDLETAAALQSGEASLIKENVDLLVWRTGDIADSTARSLSRSQIHLEHASSKAEAAYVPIEHKQVKVKLLERESDANYAILRFTQAEDKGAAIQIAPDSTLQGQSLDHVTLFRAADTGKLELISLPAHNSSGRIVLDDPIDDRAFGSLLIGADGAIGMVQDEHSGMVLRSNW